MKRIFVIIISKIIILLCKITKRGSVFPGRIAKKLDKNILYKFKIPSQVIAVTGSSGKGSTTRLIAGVYRDLGYTVAHNSSGSNLYNAIITTIIENSTITGKIKTDVVVLEVDERYAKYIFPAVKPNYVLITNITRDQPPRQGNFDLVFNEIEKAISKDMHLILNADDPYLQKFAINKENKITYFGVNKNKFSTNKANFENLNLLYCPKCNSKLDYQFYNFENIGNYNCPNCNLTHPSAEYAVTKINYDDNLITINNNYNLKISNNMLYSVYNTLSVFAVLSICSIDGSVIENSINKLTNTNNNCFTIGDRVVYTLNNKNENSTTFNQSLFFINRNKEPKTIVIGWNEISRRYKFNDLSWLYDINFEILSRHNIEKVVCVGAEQFDIATRIKLCGIDQNKIVCFRELRDACTYLKKSTKANIYAILNFDFVEQFNNYIKEIEND